MKSVIAAAAALAAATVLAPAAHASADRMYPVGTEFDGENVIPGDYRYRVIADDWGSWATCSTATCQAGNGVIATDFVNGATATGFMTVPANATYVKVSNLQLTPLTD